VSDFAGGVLTRPAHVFVVFLLSRLVSFALLLVVVALWGDAVSWPGVGWGAAMKHPKAEEQRVGSHAVVPGPHARKARGGPAGRVQAQRLADALP
jgi:hypothetical protein